MAERTIYEAFREIDAEIDNHESDLYVKDSPAVRAVLHAYGRTGASPFPNNLDGKLWWDIPFAYQPFWDRVHARAQNVGTPAASADISEGVKDAR